MNGALKVLTCILGALAVIACLATVGILGYSMINPGTQQTTGKGKIDQLPENVVVNGDTETSQAVPTEMPSVTPGQTTTPTDLNHVHDYKEQVIKKATCYEAGQIRYYCSCGDEYYVDIASTGHVADDWEMVRTPTAGENGLRVKKCIYCDEIVASESVAYEGSTGNGASPSASPSHVHQYTAMTEREPTCTLAGLRRYSCSCGSFYTQSIPAAGHVASDWTEAEKATSTHMGTEQRTCVVCGTLLDSRPVDMVAPSPSAGASASPQASGTANPTAQSGASPVPTATPHAHNYASYVLKEANCTERGIRSFVCSCGSSYAESIERDLNNHTYRAVVIPATNTTQGYTIYTCIRCNASYNDNYTMPLDPQQAYQVSNSSPSPTK